MSFGIDVRRLRLSSLLRISLLSALSVAFVGPIGFIGLVAPHIARMLFGEDHRFYLPGSVLTGAGAVAGLDRVEEYCSWGDHPGRHRNVAGGCAVLPEHYFAPPGSMS